MFNFFKEKFQTARLKARYERLMQRRLLELAEGGGPYPVAEDPGEWWLLGGGGHRLNEQDRQDARARARRLAVCNPHAVNMLRLLEIYVTGPGLMVSAVPQWPSAADAEDQKLAMMADHLWSEFLAANRRHFSYREFARRTWRDGECFLRLYAESPNGPTVRFLDPETIGETTEHPGTQGIITAEHDVEHRIAYLRIDPSSGELLERIPAEDVLHARINADSNQKRGLTWFAPVLETLGQFERWLETTLIARKLQASIVLWRKVTGGTDSSIVADVGERGPIYDSGSAIPREKYRAGTILTTSEGTDLQYLNPTTNFRDGVPLGRLMLLGAAAGSGLPEYMLTSDASNANYASTLVAEGPAVKLFHSEQLFFAGEWNFLWRWVLSQHIANGQLPPDTFERLKPEWTFPNLAARDRPRERMADLRLAEAGILSKAEVARRDNADPLLMQAEIAQESKVE